MTLKEKINAVLNAIGGRTTFISDDGTMETIDIESIGMKVSIIPDKIICTVPIDGQFKQFNLDITDSLELDDFIKLIKTGFNEILNNISYNAETPQDYRANSSLIMTLIKSLEELYKILENREYNDLSDNEVYLISKCTVFPDTNEGTVETLGYTKNKDILNYYIQQNNYSNTVTYSYDIIKEVVNNEYQ